MMASTETGHSIVTALGLVFCTAVLLFLSDSWFAPEFSCLVCVDLSRRYNPPPPTHAPSA